MLFPQATTNGVKTCNICSATLGGSKVGCSSGTNAAVGFGYYKEQTFIICTVERCATCDETGCLTCIVGYYLNGQTCTACDTGCLVCTGASTCTTCKNEYYKKSENTCSVCPIENCALCKSSTECYRCSTDYYLLLPNKDSCVKCDSGETKNEGSLREI